MKRFTETMALFIAFLVITIAVILFIAIVISAIIFLINNMTPSIAFVSMPIIILLSAFIAVVASDDR